MTSVAILCVLLAVLERNVISCYKRGKLERVARIEWAKPCDDEAQNAVHCFSIRQRMDEKGGIALDGECHVSRGVTFWKSMDINITKCLEMVSTNTCEYFQTWTFKKDVCAVATSKDMLWSDFVSRVEPPVRCPFPAGNYTGRGLTVDPDKFAALPYPLDNNVFLVKASLFDEDDVLHVCYDIGFRFMRVRS